MFIRPQSLMLRSGLTPYGLTPYRLTPSSTPSLLRSDKHFFVFSDRFFLEKENYGEKTQKIHQNTESYRTPFPYAGIYRLAGYYRLSPAGSAATIPAGDHPPPPCPGPPPPPHSVCCPPAQRYTVRPVLAPSLLRCGDIEANPGPPKKVRPQNAGKKWSDEHKAKLLSLYAHPQFVDPQDSTTGLQSIADALGRDLGGILSMLDDLGVHTDTRKFPNTTSHGRGQTVPIATAPGSLLGPTPPGISGTCVPYAVAIPIVRPASPATDRVLSQSPSHVKHPSYRSSVPGERKEPSKRSHSASSHSSHNAAASLPPASAEVEDQRYARPIIASEFGRLVGTTHSTLRDTYSLVPLSPSPTPAPSFAFRALIDLRMAAKAASNFDATLDGPLLAALCREVRLGKRREAWKAMLDLGRSTADSFFRAGGIARPDDPGSPFPQLDPLIEQADLDSVSSTASPPGLFSHRAVESILSHLVADAPGTFLLGSHFLESCATMTPLSLAGYLPIPAPPSPTRSSSRPVSAITGSFSP